MIYSDRRTFKHAYLILRDQNKLEAILTTKFISFDMLPSLFIRCIAPFGHLCQLNFII